MKCTKCGYAFDSGNMFCPFCGQKNASLPNATQKMEALPPDLPMNEETLRNQPDRSAPAGKDTFHFCVFCGSKLIGNGKYCHVCGTKIPDGIETLDDALGKLPQEKRPISEFPSACCYAPSIPPLKRSKWQRLLDRLKRKGGN